jgi:virulence factor
MVRLGIVDFDSSHCIECARRINGVGISREQFVEGGRVVAGWPGTSTMAPDRVAEFLPQVEACGVAIVDSPEQLLGQVDAILVLSLCGDAHLEHARPFLEAGVPTYVDKPFACSLADAQELVRLANEHDTLLLYASAVRYAEEIGTFCRNKGRFGPIHGILSYGPANRHPRNPGLLHYAVHPLEVLFELMGPGCQSVTSTHTDGADVVTGVWRDGRLGTLRGNRAGATAYGVVAFCENSVVPQHISTRFAYRNLCKAMLQAIAHRKVLVPHDEILETLRFAFAARLSEEQGGVPVSLSDV